jgi:hypothetical protein
MKMKKIFFDEGGTICPFAYEPYDPVAYQRFLLFATYARTNVPFSPSFSLSSEYLDIEEFKSIPPIKVDIQVVASSFGFHIEKREDGFILLKLSEYAISVLNRMSPSRERPMVDFGEDQENKKKKVESKLKSVVVKRYGDDLCAEIRIEFPKELTDLSEILTIGGNALNIKAINIREMEYGAKIVDIELIEDGETLYLTTEEDEKQFQ